MCPRNIQGGPTKKDLPLVSLSLEYIKNLLIPSFLRQLGSIYICGTFGEPIMASDCLEIFAYLRYHAPNAYITLVTNGGSRTADWWKEMALYPSQAQFSIDGLSDTNHLYRRGLDFDKVIQNAESFIRAGGVADWEFLVFRHNEHQIEQARVLANEIGFRSFRVRRTERFSKPSQPGEVIRLAVLNKDLGIDYYIEPPTQQKHINPFSQTPNPKANTSAQIRCRATEDNSLYIDANGYVLPCCWLGAHIEKSYTPWGETDVHDMIETLPEKINELSGHRKSIRSIIEGHFFQELIPQSWKSNKLLTCCSSSCDRQADIVSGQHL